LSGCAPDIFEQISMARAYICQRCLTIEVLRARRKRDSLVIIRVVGASDICRVVIVHDRVKDIDIDTSYSVTLRRG
jgi:hypothetical protein